jgi:hypothetical protein
MPGKACHGTQVHERPTLAMTCQSSTSKGVVLGRATMCRFEQQNIHEASSRVHHCCSQLGLGFRVWALHDVTPTACRRFGFQGPPVHVGQNVLLSGITFAAVGAVPAQH